jgi:dTDP-4-dehydrorhamnose reductase
MKDNKIKVLVTGACGMTGYDIIKELRKHQEFDVYGSYNSYKREKELSDVKYFRMRIDRENETIALLEILKPQIIIHCAQYNDKHEAENSDEGKESCKIVNINGTRIISKYCYENDVKLVYISDVSVFDGSKEDPYTEEDEPNPNTYYGYSKTIAENYVRMIKDYIIIRTEWLYSENNIGNNNIDNILINYYNQCKDSSNESKQIIIGEINEFGIPTNTEDLAKIIYTIINSDKTGIYNITNSGEYISLSELDKYIFDYLGIYNYKLLNQELHPIYSNLNIVKCLNDFGILDDWKISLNKYLDKVNSNFCYNNKK